MVIRKNLLPTALGLQCQPWTMNMVKSRWWPYGRRCASTSHTLALPIFPNAIRPPYGENNSTPATEVSFSLSPTAAVVPEDRQDWLESRVPPLNWTSNSGWIVVKILVAIIYQQCRMCAYHCDMKVVWGGFRRWGTFCFCWMHTNAPAVIRVSR